METKNYSLKDFQLNNLSISALDRIKEFQSYIDQQSELGCDSYWIESYSAIGSRMRISKYANVIAFVSNDYLGMSQREETKAAAREAIDKYGTGACAAQVIGGYLDIHKLLEQEIAEFVGQESALLFSSGFGANSGILGSLLGKDDLAIIDPYVHTSVMAGLQSTNIKRFIHNDIDSLEYLIKREKGNYKTIMVIIDGVYSQDGDLANLPGIINVCKKNDVILMMDDAHGIGVMGDNGRGTSEHFNCLGEIDIITGTFSKSFGAVGGFVAASKKMIQYLKYYADTNIFSAAITPQVTASVLAALKIIKREPEIREKLWSNVKLLREKLNEYGFDIGKSVSPIFPIMVRDNKKVYEVSKLLREMGIFTIGIVYPAVRMKEARLRVNVLATHTQEDIIKLVNGLIELDRMLKLK